MQKLGLTDHPVYLLMDRAYEGDETRALAVELGYTPVVPPKSNRKNPCNQVERLLRRIKRFRCIFTRYDKLDIVFLAFVHFALIIDALM